MNDTDRPDLDAIRARLQGITPGSWIAQISPEEGTLEIWAYTHKGDWPGTPVILGVLDLLERPEQDAQFIASAPSDIAALLAHADAQQTRIDTLEDALRDIEHDARLNADPDREPPFEQA